MKIQKGMDFIRKLFSYYNENIKYAFLRGYQGVLVELESQDIDLLILPSELIKAKQYIFDLAIELNYKIVKLHGGDRFHTIVIAKYENKTFFSLQIDLFLNFSLYGVLFSESTPILNRRLYNGEVYYCHPIDQFLEKKLNVSLLGKKFPDKYLALKKEVYSNHLNLLNTVSKNILTSQINLKN